MPLFNSSVADERYFKIGRKLCAYIFERAIFNGDDTLIHICMKSADLTLMEHLLDILHKFKLCDLLNRRNDHKECCVHLASAMNESNLLKKLLEFGANVNAIDSCGDTALHICIANGNDECVAVLLSTPSMKTEHHGEYAIDLSVFNDSGYSPLHLASMKNNLNVVKMLNSIATQKQCMSIFEATDGKHGNNALHIAIESGAHDVAAYLIRNKCINPSKMNKSGHTAQYLARVSNTMHLLKLMRCYTTSNDEHSMESSDNNDDADEDDASSKDSIEPQETNEVRFN